MNEVGGKGRVDLDALTGERMIEADVSGVEEEAAQVVQRSPSTSIPVVADDRMTDRREVDADLVRTAGVECARQQRRRRGLDGAPAFGC